MQFLVAPDPGRGPIDPDAKGYIIDLDQPDLPREDLRVQSILARGGWRPATDFDLAQARSLYSG